MAKGTRPRGTLAERFWPKVDRSGGPDACWPWTANRLPTGYGQIAARRADGTWRRGYGAHRVSYELNVGPIPDGHSVCHTCDNPPCVNPAHLFTAPPAVNTADMDSKGRRGDHHPSGALNGRAVLTEEAAQEIRHLHAAGVGYRRLATSFGVGKSTISRVIRGESWRSGQEA